MSLICMQIIYLVAFYTGDAVDGYGTTSIWYSVENDTVFAIRMTDVRHKPRTWLEYLHKKACKQKKLTTQEALEVTTCKRVECKCTALRTMKDFLNVKIKTAASNSCSKVGVLGKRDVKLTCEDQNQIAPLLIRLMGANEYIPSDFQNKQTISEIVHELGSCNNNLNDLPSNVIVNAIKKFSDHAHSVILDQHSEYKSTELIDAIVDLDSASAVYTKRGNTKQKKEIVDVLQELNECLGKSNEGVCEIPRYKGLAKDKWFSGFNSCTGFVPSNFKAFSSKFKGGPTIKIYANEKRWRVQLPVPVGPEVFKIWIFSPPKMKRSVFLPKIQLIAGKCAITLMHQYDYDRQKEALQSTLDTGIEGARAFQVPGGSKFPLSIALMFLEDNPEGSFAIDTYGCKSKGARFPMTTEDFGTDSWVERLTSKMRTFIQISDDSMIKTICHLDRVAVINPKLSRVGIGFEFRFVTLHPFTHVHI